MKKAINTTSYAEHLNTYFKLIESFTNYNNNYPPPITQPLKESFINLKNQIQCLCTNIDTQNTDQINTPIIQWHTLPIPTNAAPTISIKIKNPLA